MGEEEKKTAHCRVNKRDNDKEIRRKKSKQKNNAQEKKIVCL